MLTGHSHYSLCNLLNLSCCKRYLAQYASNVCCSHSAEVFFTWRDYQSRHIKCSWRNHESCIVTCRTMFLAREDNTQCFVSYTPCQHVHHWLCIAARHWQSTVKSLEELHECLVATSLDEHHWCDIAIYNADIFSL